MIRKRSFSKIGKFDVDLSHHEDFDFWLRVENALQTSYTTEVLSTFSFEPENRLSNQYKIEFKRTDVFLKKWREIIIATRFGRIQKIKK